MTPSARRIGGVLVLVALSLVGPELTSAPPPDVPPVAMAVVANLHGEWLVTTPQTLAVAEYFEPQIAAAGSPEERARLEHVRAPNIRRVASIVKVNPSHLGFYPINRRGVRSPWVAVSKYEVSRASRHEVHLLLEGGPAGQVVFTLSGKDEIHAPSLDDLLGGTVWRRAGTPGAGLP